ncbi:nucleoside triphosphate pyrophosphohydrolase family protein [Nodularia spumigena]|uniref:nucleoside triphosphate pyrophosphohydrolase family protein n=1 Tax=Nodularia spumigena TaxID=70799 RepID=UPI00232BE436|nr:nucleoside triphosphate pyrophosphohydrolase family protein [Nodularia spumigena]MDB9304244.1 nucleoside triphosphate pyrophosphohydrolase family protein [Nodularia spumigena CS-591/12]MDB9316637.1 nucleoside triphosphate pyrophosphohydrolase family protein [Nodularia spumigena CS-590/01A]MDB9326169.1 nucleoside triphosphate pyrophosphohydrolase family protein [Nodularia spumigena CS-590/02]MDB9336788.1 nucleoside triphosphate pyrophosphohydrolase family protein [Nodularia spumigena CS-590/0
MNFSEYQTQALNTDQIPAVEGTELIIPLLGLVGEVGSLMTEYKKHLRDGDAHKLFKEGIAEELGDMLWYISNLASKFNLNLEEIAKDNLRKCHDRWGWRDTDSINDKATSYIFDHDFPENERLPRQFEVEITETSKDNSVRMKAFINKKQVGNDLTDNSYSSDGYRFHDIFHLSYAAVLGWSVVTRSNLKCKRKSNPSIDEVEDGGRAVAIEEGISALVFSYAKDHDFLEGVKVIDYQLLKTIKNMTSHLEVSQCSLGDWEKAIFMGYDVWRQVEKNRGGTVVVDLDARLITYQI